jgi:hypothetical protein
MLLSLLAFTAHAEQPPTREATPPLIPGMWGCVSHCRTSGTGTILLFLASGVAGLEDPLSRRRMLLPEGSLATESWASRSASHSLQPGYMISTGAPRHLTLTAVLTLAELFLRQRFDSSAADEEEG